MCSWLGNHAWVSKHRGLETEASGTRCLERKEERQLERQTSALDSCPGENNPYSAGDSPAVSHVWEA